MPSDSRFQPTLGMSHPCSTCGGKLAKGECSNEQHVKARLVDEVVTQIRAWGAGKTHLEIAATIHEVFHPKSRFPE